MVDFLGLGGFRTQKTACGTASSAKLNPPSRKRPGEGHLHFCLAKTHIRSDNPAMQLLWDENKRQKTLAERGLDFSDQ